MPRARASTFLTPLFALPPFPSPQDVDSALVESLVEYLPEGQRSPDALRAQLRSPQLQQTMSRLTSILNSAQFGQLMASLSLPVGQNTGLGVDAFLAAILAQAEKQKEEQNK